MIAGLAAAVGFLVLMTFRKKKEDSHQKQERRTIAFSPWRWQRASLRYLPSYYAKFINGRKYGCHERSYENLICAYLSSPHHSVKYRRPYASYRLRRHLLQAHTIWLRSYFPHRTRVFNILFGWHFASKEWWSPYCFLFHALEMYSYSLSFNMTTFGLFLSYEILPIVVSIVFK